MPMRNKKQKQKSQIVCDALEPLLIDLQMLRVDDRDRLIIIALLVRLLRLRSGWRHVEDVLHGLHGVVRHRLELRHGGLGKHSGTRNADVQSGAVVGRSRSDLGPGATNLRWWVWGWGWGGGGGCGGGAVMVEVVGLSKILGNP